MVRVVPDTNIWVSALIKPQGRYAQLLRSVLDRGELVTAEAILAELKDVLSRQRIVRKYGLTKDRLAKALILVRSSATVLTELPELNVVTDDPDDNKIVACALSAKAHFIVSYDPHLTSLGSYEGIGIVTPKELQRRLGL